MRGSGVMAVMAPYLSFGLQGVAGWTGSGVMQGRRPHGEL